MDTLKIILQRFGIGAAAGFGFVIAIVVPFLITTFIEKLHSRRKLETDFIENQFNTLGRNYIALSNEMKIISDYLGKKLKDFRFEFWNRDLILPTFTIATGKFPEGKNCTIRIEGTEIFSGEINSQLSDENKADLIANRIRLYLIEGK